MRPTIDCGIYRIRAFLRPLTLIFLFNIIAQPAWVQALPLRGGKQLRGVYAVTKFSEPFTAATLDNPFVDGLMVRTFWRDVEPQPGEYNWSYIDSQIQTAVQHQKHVVLTVIPGAWTPDWARAGVQQSDFTIKYGHKKGEPDLLPLPWDQTYLSRWFTFVKALGARYDSNPAVVMVPATGPTATTAEMSLPNQPEAVRKWIELGYTPKKYEAAWDQTCAAYSEAFPTTLIGLTLYPGLPIPNNSEKVKTRETVVAQAQKRLNGRMAIQTSGLSARKAGRPHRRGGYSLVEGHSGQMTVGFQCGTSASERPERMGSSDPVQALRRTIDFGLEAKIDFLEIYENDLTNPAQQKNIQYAHSQLMGH